MLQQDSMGGMLTKAAWTKGRGVGSWGRRVASSPSQLCWKPAAPVETPPLWGLVCTSLPPPQGSFWTKQPLSLSAYPIVPQGTSDTLLLKVQYKKTKYGKLKLARQSWLQSIFTNFWYPRKRSNRILTLQKEKNGTNLETSSADSLRACPSASTPLSWWGSQNLVLHSSLLGWELLH